VVILSLILFDFRIGDIVRFKKCHDKVSTKSQNENNTRASGSKRIYE